MPFFPFFFVVIIQQYKYRDLTVREITNVISQYKDLKPVMDAYGKLNDTDLLSLLSCLSYIFYAYIWWYISNLFCFWHENFLFFLVFNDGSSRDLMSLTGTVPVSYRGKECFSDFYCCSHCSVLESERLGHRKLLVSLVFF